jgi:hypothetical protein
MSGHGVEPGTRAGPPGPDSAADPAVLKGLVRLLASHPGLLLEHLQAHVALLVIDLAEARARLERQAMWWAGALASAAVAATLSGTALLHWKGRTMPPPATAGDLAVVAVAGLSPWWLAAVPAAPLLLALLCTAGGLGWLGPRRVAPPGLQARFEGDRASFHEGAP